MLIYKLPVHVVYQLNAIFVKPILCAYTPTLSLQPELHLCLQYVTHCYICIILIISDYTLCVSSCLLVPIWVEWEPFVLVCLCYVRLLFVIKDNFQEYSYLFNHTPDMHICNNNTHEHNHLHTHIHTRIHSNDEEICILYNYITNNKT